MEEVLLIHLIYQLVECINMVWYICVLVHLSLSIQPSIHSCIPPPIYLSIHLTACIRHLSIPPPIYLSIYLSIHLSVYSSIFIYISIQSCLHFWRLHLTTTRWCLSWIESHTITPNGIYWTEPYTTPNGISWTESHAVSNGVSWTESHKVWIGTSSNPQWTHPQNRPNTSHTPQNYMYQTPPTKKLMKFVKRSRKNSDEDSEKKKWRLWM